MIGATSASGLAVHESRVNCPVCDTPTAPGKLAGFIAFPCACGFIFAEPGANSSKPDLYDEGWSKDVNHPTYGYANGRYSGRNVWKQQDLLDRLENFRQLNRILDVGCSAAFFLGIAKDRGWNVQGVEVAEWAATFSRQELGVPVFHGLLHAAAFASASFDVAFSSHVLEHIEQPKALIREMQRVLRPGGALVITVPTQFRSPTYVFFGEWFGDGPPRHVSFFDRQSLTRLLEESGFTVTHCGHNVELKLLLKRLRKKESAASEATNLLSPPRRRRKSPKGPGLAVKFAKRVVNGLGERFGIGDELTLIAVKQ